VAGAGVNAYQVWCYLLPLMVGFGLPALLSWRPGLDGIRPASILLAVLVSLTLGLSFMARAPEWTCLRVTAFALSFAVLVAGLHLACLRDAVGQIVTGVVVTAMMGTVFYFGRGIDDSLAPEVISTRIGLCLSLNPYAVIATSIFGEQILHSGTLYATGLADYQFVYPAWGRVALGYVLIGVPLIAIGSWTRRMLSLNSPPTPPGAAAAP
jgi:hypothetical protein